MSKAEDGFEQQVMQSLRPRCHWWQREYSFHKERGWRFDFAWPDVKLAVEIEGGTFTQGRHTRGTGFAEDCVKYNEAALLGWTVLRFTTQQVREGRALDTVNRWFRKFVKE